ncbi:hypothetical protein [Pedobacter cryoconitis]|uniref:SseB protein N-terminal domain-containing protein n=1 Tax=Pedobacter cryoconitis TaxID=188932 RepID=A0A7X0MJL5_9SPHI|nr:hypothetical protein [Pedobacter cryoconitis]MBB6501602.1 hypothetical protein [Pedobacter cryoconitis]
MGLFDIFKKTETTKEDGTEKVSETESVAGSGKQKLPQEFLGDLEKTEMLAVLLAVPMEQRDVDWVDRFLTDLPMASLRCGTPQVIAGPDGFPYFQLFVPKPGEEYQSFVIERMMGDFILERGYGIVINPGEGQPDWVLSYGDILNYHLNGGFFTAEDSQFSISSTTEEEIVEEGEEIMVGQPAETVLPSETRKLLKDFFELNGIEGPKVLLMARKIGEELKQDLAFNITPERFESEVHYRNMMQTVTWYLPRHYSVIGLHDDNIENGFMPL